MLRPRRAVTSILIANDAALDSHWHGPSSVHAACELILPLASCRALVSLAVSHSPTAIFRSDCRDPSSVWIHRKRRTGRSRPYRSRRGPSGCRRRCRRAFSRRDPPRPGRLRKGGIPGQQISHEVKILRFRPRTSRQVHQHVRPSPAFHRFRFFPKLHTPRQHADMLGSMPRIVVW